MAELKLTSHAKRLLDHHRLRGRSFPTPRYWDRLQQMLVEEAEKRGKTPPPEMLVVGLDSDPNDADRMQRLDEQVAWADHNRLLHRIQMFFDAMPISGWVRKDGR
jgi:hypothetical protein